MSLRREQLEHYSQTVRNFLAQNKKALSLILVILFLSSILFISSLDIRSPEVKIVSPQENSYVSGDTEIKVDIKTYRTIYNVTISFDNGNNWQEMQKGIKIFQKQTFIYEWDTQGLSDGTWNVTVKVSDIFGKSSIETIYVQVDNTHPSTNIVFPYDLLHQKLSGKEQLLLVDVEDDGSGVKSVKYRIDNQFWVFLAYNETTNLYESRIDTTSYSDGNHTLEVFSEDQNGNEHILKYEVFIENPLDDNTNPFFDFFSISDFQCPTIMGIEDNYSIVVENQNAQVNATVVDDVCVDNVFLSYSIEDSGWTNVTMFSVGNDTYSTIIPLQGNSELFYIISANDTSNNWVTSEKRSLLVELPIDEVNTSQSDPTIDAWSISPTLVDRTHTFTASYRITNHHSYSMYVWLGCSIRDPSGNDIDDSSNDVRVNLPAGSTDWYTRSFRVTEGIPTGYYDLALAIWERKEAGQMVNQYDGTGWVPNYLYVNNDPPSTPTLYDPGSTDPDGSFVVDWSTSIDLDGYVVYYELLRDTSSTFDNNPYTYTPTSSSQSISGLSSGTYYFKVRARDNDGGYSDPWSNIESITVVPPSPPTLDNWGTSTRQVSRTQTFTVNYYITNHYSNSMYVWLGCSIRDPSGNDIDDPSNDVRVNLPAGSTDWYTRSFRVTEGIPTGYYDIRLAIWERKEAGQMVNELDGIDWQLDYLQVTNNPPNTPTLYDPGSTDPDGNFNVDWSTSTDSDGQVVGYQLQRDTSSSFNNNPYTYTTTSSEQYISGLDRGTYYFRVRARDNDGGYSDPWSNIESIIVEPPSYTIIFNVRLDNGQYLPDHSSDYASIVLYTQSYDPIGGANYIDDNQDQNDNPVSEGTSQAIFQGIEEASYYYDIYYFGALVGHGSVSVSASQTSFTVKTDPDFTTYGAISKLYVMDTNGNPYPNTYIVLQRYCSQAGKYETVGVNPAQTGNTNRRIIADSTGKVIYSHTFRPYGQYKALVYTSDPPDPLPSPVFTSEFTLSSFTDGVFLIRPPNTGTRQHNVLPSNPAELSSAWFTTSLPYTVSFADKMTASPSQALYYTVYLDSRDYIKIELNGQSGTNFDVYLRSSTGSVLKSSSLSSYPDTILHRVDSDGWYYIEVHRNTGPQEMFKLEISHWPPFIGDITFDVRMDDGQLLPVHSLDYDCVVLYTDSHEYLGTSYIDDDMDQDNNPINEGASQAVFRSIEEGSYEYEIYYFGVLVGYGAISVSDSQTGFVVKTDPDFTTYGAISKLFVLDTNGNPYPNTYIVLQRYCSQAGKYETVGVDPAQTGNTNRRIVADSSGKVIYSRIFRPYGKYQALIYTSDPAISSPSPEFISEFMLSSFTDGVFLIRPPNTGTRQHNVLPSNPAELSSAWFTTSLPYTVSFVDKMTASSSQSIYYGVYLNSRRNIEIELNGDINTDFDLYLRSSSGSILKSSIENSYPDEILYTVDSAGWYYIEVHRKTGPQEMFKLEISHWPPILVDITFDVRMDDGQLLPDHPNDYACVVIYSQSYSPLGTSYIDDDQDQRHNPVSEGASEAIFTSIEEGFYYYDIYYEGVLVGHGEISVSDSQTTFTVETDPEFTASGSIIKLLVMDTNGNPYPNIYIVLQRYCSQTDEYETVGVDPAKNEPSNIRTTTNSEGIVAYSHQSRPYGHYRVQVFTSDPVSASTPLFTCEFIHLSFTNGLFIVRSPDLSVSEKNSPPSTVIRLPYSWFPTSQPPYYISLNDKMTALQSKSVFYSIDLAEGDRIALSLSAVSGTDYDLYLLSSSALVLRYSTESSYPDQTIPYDVSSPGRYYIEIYCHSGTQSMFELSVSITQTLVDLTLVDQNIDWTDGTVSSEFKVQNSGDDLTCRTEFQLMNPEGVIIYSDSNEVFLPSDGETAIQYDWISGDLSPGDYYATFVCRSLDGTLLLSSGWIHAFTIADFAYLYQFDNIPENTQETWNAVDTIGSDLILAVDEYAIFSFSLLHWFNCVEFEIVGKIGSDFNIEIGNETFTYSRDFYLTQPTILFKVYNFPDGDYNVTITAQSIGTLEALTIKVHYIASPELFSLYISDGLSEVSDITGLCGTSKIYQLGIYYEVNQLEDLEFSIIETFSGTILHQEIKSIIVLDRLLFFTIQFDFPASPTTFQIEFKFRLTKSDTIYSFTTIFNAKTYTGSIELNECSALYLKGPPMAACIAFEHPYLLLDPRIFFAGLPIASYIITRRRGSPCTLNDLEALDITDVKIIDFTTNEGLIDTVTLSFVVKNKFEPQFLWVKPNVYYDLCIRHPNAYNYISLLQPGEEEYIVVPNVPVVYLDGYPMFYIEFDFKWSWWANSLDLILKALKVVPILGALPADLIMEFVDLITDHFMLEYSKDDCDELISELEKTAVNLVLKHAFGTTNLDIIYRLTTAFSVAMLLAQENPQMGLVVLTKMIRQVFKIFKAQPDRLIKIAATVFQKQITKETAKYIATSALSILNAIEGLIDAAFKFIAPSVEQKIIVAGLTEDSVEPFSTIELLDPLFNITLAGNVDNSLLNLTRTYSIEKLLIDIKKDDNGDANFLLKILPATGQKNTLIATFSDESSRSAFLMSFGILDSDSKFIEEDQYLIIEGQGTFIGTYDTLFLEIDGNDLSGFIEQPFDAFKQGDVWVVNVSMVYPFGESVADTVTLILPSNSYEINVLTPNYQIDDTTVTWQGSPSSIEVQFKMKETGDLCVKLTNDDDDSHRVDIYVDGVFWKHKDIDPGETLSTVSKTVTGDNLHTIKIKWHDDDTDKDYSLSKTLNVTIGQTVYFSFNIDAHEPPSPSKGILAIQANFTSPVKKRDIVTIDIIITDRNNNTMEVCYVRILIAGLKFTCNDLGEGLYRAVIDTEQIELGTYNFTIIASKDGYEYAESVYTLEIEKGILPFIGELTEYLSTRPMIGAFSLFSILILSAIVIWFFKERD